MEDHFLDAEELGGDHGSRALRRGQPTPQAAQQQAPFLFLLGGNGDEKGKLMEQEDEPEDDQSPLIAKLKDPHLSEVERAEVEVKILVALYEQSSKLEEGFKINSCTLSFADQELESKHSHFFGIINEHKLRIRLLLLNFFIMMYSVVEWFSVDLTHPGYLVITRGIYLTLNLIMFTLSFVYREWYRDNIQAFSISMIMSTAYLIIVEGFLLNIVYSPLLVLVLICFMVLAVAGIRVRSLAWTISSIVVFVSYDIFALTLVTKGDSLMKAKDIPLYLTAYNILFLFLVIAFWHLSKKAELSSRYAFAVSHRVYRDPSFRETIAGRGDAGADTIAAGFARSFNAHRDAQDEEKKKHDHAHGPPIPGAIHNSHGPSAVIALMNRNHYDNLFSYLDSLRREDEISKPNLEPRIVKLGDPEWPSWMQRYEYINSGYRINYSIKDALYSMFTVHNETVNVWTEFGPMFVFAVGWTVLAYTEDAFKHAPKTDTILVHMSIFTAFILRPLCSGLAHLMHPINERWFVISWGVDYASIVITILMGSFVYGRWTFYCLDQQQMFFFISVSGLCLMTLVAVLFVSNVMVRVGSFFLYTVFANGVPFFYSIYLKYANSANSHFDVPDSYIYFWLGMLLLVGFGMVIKSTYIPERFFKPGTLDIVGQSHQIWHLMINAGNALSVFAWCYYMRWRQHSPCPPSNFTFF